MIARQLSLTTKRSLRTILATGENPKAHKRHCASSTTARVSFIESETKAEEITGAEAGAENNAKKTVRRLIVGLGNPGQLLRICTVTSTNT